jgi:hypothetical protein
MVSGVLRSARGPNKFAEAEMVERGFEFWKI